jgi:ubiquinone biosynthesis accessory factor UbiJ
MTALVRFLNHVLGQHAWARARLAPHAGKFVKIETGLLDVRLEITPSGDLAQAPAEGGGGIVFRFDPAQVPLMLADPEAALKKVHIQGDAELAQVAGLLAREVRWDAEEDLSRVVGDVPAYHAMRIAREFAAWGQDAAQRLTGATSAYLAEEAPVLVRQTALEEHAAGVAAARDACERLEKRIGLLEARRRTDA